MIYSCTHMATVDVKGLIQHPQPEGHRYQHLRHRASSTSHGIEFRQSLHGCDGRDRAVGDSIIPDAFCSAPARSIQQYVVDKFKPTKC